MTSGWISVCAGIDEEAEPGAMNRAPTMPLFCACVITVGLFNGWRALAYFARCRKKVRPEPL
jgi:hypothetical protein